MTSKRWYAWSMLIAGTGVSMLPAVEKVMVPAGSLPPIAAAAVYAWPPLCFLFVVPVLRAAHLAREDAPR
ncbi:hypothetical protein [Rhodococcus marinonascens]|uniref:hypothetical protein n=1 Tax=Rhodococcus marinonascens TaxID=38311 RepID=UPI000B1812FB|nr:hypothetical protein [Rhodococcus marinonascens]